MIIEIPFSSPDELLIKEGETVNFNTPLIKKSQTIKEIINIAQKLNVDFLKIFKFLKKFVGENVSKGDVLAEKKGFITSKKIISPINGIITLIDHNTGEMIIESHLNTGEILKAFFVGKVNEVKKDRFYLKVKIGISFNTKDSSAVFGGFCFYPSNLSFFSLKSEEVANKIIIAEKVDSLLLTKLEALGAKGIVTLYKLPTLPLNIYHCQLTNIDNFKQIINLKYPYCLNIKKTGKIYFYE